MEAVVCLIVAVRTKLLFTTNGFEPLRIEMHDGRGPHRWSLTSTTYFGYPRIAKLRIQAPIYTFLLHV